MPDYRGGLGMSLCIMAYGTQHPHSKKEHRNFTTSSSLLLIKPILDEIQPFKNSKFYYEIHTDAGQILNGCISFNIGPNPTKLEDFVKLGVLILAVGVLCPMSHNTQTRTQSPTIWNPAMKLIIQPHSQGLSSSRPAEDWRTGLSFDCHYFSFREK